MRVAFIGQKGIPALQGGVERHVEELALHLVSRGVEPIVYTRAQYINPKLKEFKGIKLISLSTIRTKHLDALIHTFLACLDVRKRKVDVIHFHSIGPSFWVWFAKFLNPNIPVVGTFHSQCYRHKKWGAFAKMSLLAGEAVCCLASDTLIVVSRNLKKMVLKRYKRIATYIPNGVPDFKKVKFDVAKKWGLKENGYILYVGRLVISKRADLLIQAFNLQKTNKKLVIVGDELYPNGYEEKLKKMAKNNLNIIFTGRLESGSRELAELFSNAYLFVQPSEIEGLSISLLEAMAYERAVLVSDIPENIEAISDVGFSFECSNLESFSAKLKKLLASPMEVLKMGKAGKKRVSENYSWNAIADDILRVYQESKEEVCGKKGLFSRVRYVVGVLKRIF